MKHSWWTLFSARKSPLTGHWTDWLTDWYYLFRSDANRWVILVSGHLYLSGNMRADSAWQESVSREKLSEWNNTLWSLNAAQNINSELLMPVRHTATIVTSRQSRSVMLSNSGDTGSHCKHVSEWTWALQYNRLCVIQQISLKQRTVGGNFSHLYLRNPVRSNWARSSVCVRRSFNRLAELQWEYILRRLWSYDAQQDINVYSCQTIIINNKLLPLLYMDTLRRTVV